MSLPNIITDSIENGDTTPNEIPPADLRTSRPHQPDLSQNPLRRFAAGRPLVARGERASTSDHIQPRAHQPTMPAQARGFQPPANQIQPGARQPTMPAQARGTITPAMRSVRTTLFSRVLTVAEYDALDEERDRYTNSFEEWASNPDNLDFGDDSP